MIGHLDHQYGYLAYYLSIYLSIYRDQYLTFLSSYSYVLYLIDLSIQLPLSIYLSTSPFYLGIEPMSVIPFVYPAIPVYRSEYPIYQNSK